MSAFAATGMLTITDYNDAKALQCYILHNGSLQQTYNGDDGVVWAPNRSSGNSPLTLTFVATAAGTSQGGGAVDIVPNIDASGVIWKLDSMTGAALTTIDSNTLGGTKNSVATVYTNLDPASYNQRVIYAYANYVDSSTGLISQIIATCTLSVLKTGSDATYIEVDGQGGMKKSPNTTKSIAIVTARLIRKNGNVDTTNVGYKWYKVNYDGSEKEISTLTDASGGLRSEVAPYLHTSPRGTSQADDKPHYGFMDQALVAAYRAGTSGATPTINHLNGSSGSYLKWVSSAITQANASTVVAYSDGGIRGLIISEEAVTGSQLYRVEIKDLTTSGNPVFTKYFTVTDQTDNFSVAVKTTTGDKLPNGTGSTTVYPIVSTAGSDLSDTTGWEFWWKFYDQNGKRASIINTTAMSNAAGATITGVTISPASPDQAGDSVVMTVTVGAGITTSTFSNSDVVKLVTSSGVAMYYEITTINSTSGTVTSIITKAVTANLKLGNTASTGFQGQASGYFVGGKAFACYNPGTSVSNAPSPIKTAGGSVAQAGNITLTGYDIDVKGTIYCDANRPTRY